VNLDAYSVILVKRGTAAVAEEVTRIEAMLEATGHRARAVLLRSAYVDYVDELRVIAREVAQLAHRSIVEEEKRTRVRPDTHDPSAEGGNERLETWLGYSDPIPELPGSVAVNDMRKLDRHVPWWWTNEAGFSGHIGRVVHGFFYDAGFTGASRPNPAEFREHPLFRAEGPQRESGFRKDGKLPPRSTPKGTRPGMLIKNPIPERRFVRRGAEIAEREWHSRVQRVRSAFIAKVDSIAAAQRASAR
jgi:hypothetical protein